MAFELELPESKSAAPLLALDELSKKAIVGSDVVLNPADHFIDHDLVEAEGMQEELLEWLWEELKGEGDVLDSWKSYEDDLGVRVPSDIDELRDMHPTFLQTVYRLYKAKEAFFDSGRTDPYGREIWRSLHLVLMPWRALSDHSHDLTGWVEELMPYIGGRFTMKDTVDLACSDVSTIYRSQKPGGDALTLRQYLDGKIATDGPWGMMLLQTTPAAGLSNVDTDSVDWLTDEGRKRYTIDGVQIDDFGVCEAIAMGMQMLATKGEINNMELAWLAANRLKTDQWDHVPILQAGNDRLNIATEHSSMGAALDIKLRVAIL